MGGYTGIVTDRTTLQFQYAEPFERAGDVESARAVRQGARFSLLWREMLENTQNLYLWQDAVTAFRSNKIRSPGSRLGWECNSARKPLF